MLMGEELAMWSQLVEKAKREMELFAIPFAKMGITEWARSAGKDALMALKTLESIALSLHPTEEG